MSQRHALTGQTRIAGSKGFHSSWDTVMSSEEASIAHKQETNTGEKGRTIKGTSGHPRASQSQNSNPKKK